MRSTAERPITASLIDAVLIAAAIALIARLGARALPPTFESTFAWMLVAGLLLGVLAADLASGVAHWFCDTFFDEGTPFIGPWLIRPFRDHHVDPQGILQHGALELHGNSCLPVVVVLGAGAAIPIEPGGAAADFGRAALFFMAVATLATNQIHRWAHADHSAAPVRWLQRHGVILSPEGHARHHRGSFGQSFCITTGWLNPILDATDLLPRLARRIRPSAAAPG